MDKKTKFICNMLDLLSYLPKDRKLHYIYHSFAKVIADYWKIPQFFLLMRRSFSGTQQHELSFWVYAAGQFVDKYGNNRPNPIVEISLNESISINEINKKTDGTVDFHADKLLREKLYLASAPATDIDFHLAALRIADLDRVLAAMILTPERYRSLLIPDNSAFIARILRLSIAKSSDAYSQSEYYRLSLAAVAGDLLNIAEHPFINTSENSQNKNLDTFSEDVLQNFLDHTRKKLKAEKCALFLVDYQKRSLTLERISEESGTLHYERIPYVPTYNIENYDPDKKGQGVTPWVLHRKKPFNARSYEELINSSEGHHKGNWDPFIYGGEKEARNSFQCLYMTPLLAGNESIGVLKYENRITGASDQFFNQSEEREIDLLSEVVTNIVLSQRIERNRYDRALPAISRTLMTYFGKQELYEKLLEECRNLLKADLCSLFLVSNQNDLKLKSIVGRLSPEKQHQLQGFCYKNYRESKGMTCWILQSNKAFNVRSYEDLVTRSEGHHWGRWDNIVYDNDTKNRFRSLYSIPLRIGEEDIGVLKVENKSVSPFYFTDSDERLFDMIGRLIAIGVKYDNEQYLGSMLRAAELGFLASGIAHEFKNYLQRFTSIGSLISNQGQISEIRSYISDLQTQIQMASQSIDSFKLIRNRKAEVETFNIDQLVRQIIDISSVRVRNSEIEFEYINKGVEMVTMNPAEVQTILINLLRNAFEAVSDIRVDRIVQLKIHEEKGKVIFEIADSGGDLDPKIAKHMFAPYYTTKMMGMGMGLFWVREIVERNHGVVSHYPSKNFRGTTFRVELPNIIKK